MSRKIYGTIKDKDTGQGIKGLRVEAWDDDWPDGDDFMGAATTNASGDYKISYSGGHWDPTISHGITKWRPDIYVRVLTKNAAGNWVKLERSRVYTDHKLRKDLRIDFNVEVQKPISKKTTFEPHRNGFHFDNSFTVSPDILGVDLGSWHMGLCGGMCAGALNRFSENKPIPADTRPPAAGTPLFKELLSRQIKTLVSPLTSGYVLGEIYDWQSAPDEGHWYRKSSVGARTKKEWWDLKDRLDDGQPTILVLIRVEGYLANPTHNHQVLAIGYEYNPTTKDVKIQVYDPNREDTTQTLSMNIGLPNSRLNARDSTGKRLRGFFVNPNGSFASS